MKVVAGQSTSIPVAAMIRQRMTDYVSMTKPRIAVMVLITVGAGYLMAAGPNAKLMVLIHTVIGTALVAAGSSVWNQWIERYSDAKMRRTENRPLPGGRVHQLEAVVFGTMLAVTGCNYLIHALGNPMPALIAAITFLSYVLIYTPLKPITTFNTIIGAVPGALPPVIGYAAAKPTFELDSLSLFLLLFCWQLPHFMAIAWMYRAQYGAAGLKMLPTVDATGSKTSRSMVLWCVVLIICSLLPIYLHFHWLYLVGALVLGAYYLRSTLRFVKNRTEAQARQVLKASIYYLPGMMALLLIHALLVA